MKRPGKPIFGTINGEQIDAYFFTSPIPGRRLRCLVSEHTGWEHVSVCVEQGNKQKTPTWKEMCFVKDQFWSEDECVMQLHPPKQDYVNIHEHVLHLWRPTDAEIPQPDRLL